MARKYKDLDNDIEKIENGEAVEANEAVSEKDQLLALYDILKSRGIDSISKLEVMIANCRD